MLYFGGGSMLLPWVALWVSDWRILSIVTSAPLAFGIVAPFIFPESARWLSSRGKTDRAVKILHRVEHINGNPIPQQAIDDFVELSSQKHDEGESLWVVLVSHPQLRWVLLLLVALYTCCGIVFDGLIRLSGSLGSSMFITFTLSSATEFPSIMLVILLLDRLGRRVMAVGSAFIAGALSIIAAFLGLGLPRVILAISARFFANMTFNTTIQWVAEVLPSGARASGSSLVHVTSFLLASSTPFIVYLENIWNGLPFIVIGAVAMLATVISALLPETQGQVMPHSCADANRLIQNHSLLGKIACCSQREEEDVEYKS
ncbi:sugar transporter domain-containing protein [Phthorimaea operculella]|nr:sugar transporter domain-containing protein [Phthorimaea operculella]